MSIEKFNTIPPHGNATDTHSDTQTHHSAAAANAFI